MMVHSIKTYGIDPELLGMDANWTLEDQDEYGQSLEILLTVAHKLYQYYVPTVVLVGLLCSFLVVIVLLKTKLRKRYFSHLFAAISICDIGFLLTILCIWTKNQGVDVYIMPGLCQMVIFSSHFFPFLSFWYSICGCVVLVLRGRSHQMKMTMFNGTGKARLLVISMCIFALTIFIYKTWTNGILIVMGTRVCTVLPENEATMRVLNVFDMVLLLVLPLTLFLVFDVWLISLLITRCVYGVRFVYFPVIDRSFKVLLMHSVLFHLFVGPGCISKLIVIVRLINNTQFYTIQDIVIDNFLQYLFYSYFGFKSILHIIVSRTFRHHTRKMFSLVRNAMSIHAVLYTTPREQTFV